MKLPKELIIGESIWHVKRNRKTLVINDHPLDGMCDPSDNTIYVHSNLRGKEALVTFVHEVLHAFEFEFDIKIGHPMIEALEYKLTHFLLDNFLGGL